jgi:hypothetical protein
VVLDAWYIGFVVYYCVICVEDLGIQIALHKMRKAYRSNLSRRNCARCLTGVRRGIGSRLPGRQGVRLSWARCLSGRLFALAVRSSLGLSVHDTQCGFKMFRREVAHRLFALCKQPGYLIDLELLLHAQRLGYTVAEVPVEWRDVPGSKVRLIRDGYRMLRGLWQLRRQFADAASHPQRHTTAGIFREPLNWPG